ncbi:hypothetical protein IGL76_000355 [Enterococcus sp. DIV2381]|uniref:Uncharacterized protein n=1 Tax=Candidatus Enterococcus mangumiae TaxID=2230878 RepID=A0ABZ2SW60_9ENTE
MILISFFGKNEYKVLENVTVKKDERDGKKILR